MKISSRSSPGDTRIAPGTRPTSWYPSFLYRASVPLPALTVKSRNSIPKSSRAKRRASRRSEVPCPDLWCAGSTCSRLTVRQ